MYDQININDVILTLTLIYMVWWIYKGLTGQFFEVAVYERFRY